MPEKPRPPLKLQIFRPHEYDREVIARAREVIDLARKVLAESDPHVLMGRRRAEPPSKENE
jgi:hypothetical protein